MRAEVALLGRVVLGFDEDGVVGAGGDARLAPDADRLVEVHDPVVALEHGRGRARVDAGRVLALVAARDLERPSTLREEARINVFDVGPGDREGDFVFRLAGGGAGMAPDAGRLVDDLRPRCGPGSLGFGNHVVVTSSCSGDGCA